MNDPTVIAAVIGAVATLLAAIVSPIASRSIEKQKALKITPAPDLDRSEALFGTWVGRYFQENGKPEFIGEHPAELIFRKEKGEIVGDMTLQVGNTNREYKAHLANTIFDGFHLKVDYVNKASTVTHFGTMFGKLSSNGLLISGPFVGYGLLSEQFVSGNIKLEKKQMA